MKLLFPITIFCFYISTSTSVLPDCGRIPPNFWCKNMQIATHCGVAAACQRYNQLSANRKVHVQIIMESLCPFCQRFIVDKFYHDVYLKFRGYVEVELVPYGNAERNGMSITCQHGEKECEINTFFSCAQQHVNPSFDFVYCIERELKNFSSFEVAKTRCYREQNVPTATQTRLQSCTYGNEGRQLQLQAARITEAEFPELHLTVPYTIINNVSLVSAQHMRSNLGLMICDWYVGRNFVPPPCKELS